MAGMAITVFKLEKNDVLDSNLCMRYGIAVRHSMRCLNCDEAFFGLIHSNERIEAFSIFYAIFKHDTSTQIGAGLT